MNEQLDEVLRVTSNVQRIVSLLRESRYDRDLGQVRFPVTAGEAEVLLTEVQWLAFTGSALFEVWQLREAVEEVASAVELFVDEVREASQVDR